MKQSAHLTLTNPKVEDGAAMWELAKTTSLDTNASYTYVMMCEYFNETCTVAKIDEEVVGFIVGFIPPKKPDTFFIWQIGIDESQQATGLALDLIKRVVRNSEEHVQYVEATVTPSNRASQSVLQKLARNQKTEFNVFDCFSKHHFPNDNHDEEKLYRVGPIKITF